MIFGRAGDEKLQRHPLSLVEQHCDLRLVSREANHFSDQTSLYGIDVCRVKRGETGIGPLSPEKMGMWGSKGFRAGDCPAVADTSQVAVGSHSPALHCIADYALGTDSTVTAPGAHIDPAVRKVMNELPASRQDRSPAFRPRTRQRFAKWGIVWRPELAGDVIEAAIRGNMVGLAREISASACFAGSPMGILGRRFICGTFARHSDATVLQRKER
jgi:hypothetical protein